MKALMVAIQPKWLKMILDGKKKFEFRNWKNADENVLVGTVLYFYESKGKKKQHTSWYQTPSGGLVGSTEITYEGRGKVVAKAVVKRVYDLNKNEDYADWICRNETKLDVPNFTGYIRQHYAIELDQVEAIEPKDVTEFYSQRRLEKVRQ
jgi:hypothetical protein